MVRVALYIYIYIYSGTQALSSGRQRKSLNKNKNYVKAAIKCIDTAMKRTVIGLFGRVMNNNELCSDWLFHSAAYQQEGNTGRKIYI